MATGTISPLTSHPSPLIPSRYGTKHLTARPPAPPNTRLLTPSLAKTRSRRTSVSTRANVDSVDRVTIFHRDTAEDKKSSGNGAPETTKIPDTVTTPAKESLSRNDFPKGFLFGAGSSSYQVEGAYNEDGKGLSIWDVYTHEQQGKIIGGGDGKIACDSYHKYKDDVRLLKDAGMDVYRFSISWPRILPTGSLKGGINQKGIDYYNNLINELKENGIEPFITLFHWDVPYALELEYGGFLDRRIVDDFKDFAKICFENFGDRVKRWATLNEPYTFVYFGYDRGLSAPGRCSSYLGCAAGDSATEPYIVNHNLILAHATVVKLFREIFPKQGTSENKGDDEQQPEIGMTINTDWMYPFEDTKRDSEAANRALDFCYGWHLEPLVHGDYPSIMKALVRDRLPKFTQEEKALIKGSYDYIGINYYSTQFASSLPFSNDDPPHSYNNDKYAEIKAERKLFNGKPGDFHTVTPFGMKELLLYTHTTFNSPKIYITENGIGADDIHDDQIRSDFYRDILANVKAAIDAGVKVKGFFAWSLTDTFEWAKGYTIKVGLTYIDFKNDPDRKRQPKASYEWFKNFLNPKST